MEVEVRQGEAREARSELGRWASLQADRVRVSLQVACLEAGNPCTVESKIPPG